MRLQGESCVGYRRFRGHWWGYNQQLDHREPEAIEACMNTVEELHGRLDILVNNAAWNIGIAFADLHALNVGWPGSGYRRAGHDLCHHNIDNWPDHGG